MATFKRGNLTIFLFPYLFLEKEFEFNGFILKPSFKANFDKESKRLQSHLKKLALSFKTTYTPNISQYSYGWTTIHSEQEWNKLRDSLNTISTIFRYSQLEDRRNSGSYSNFDYVVIEIAKSYSAKDYAYYEGYLNGRNSIKINYPRTKFCPSFEINPIIFSPEDKHELLAKLFHFSKFYHSDQETKRILRAMEWFNKSYRNDPEIDDIERFTNVAIAFEALFNTSPESVLASLITGITSLLGESEEMEDWIKKFYNQRSRLFHGDEEPNILYKGKKSSEYHITHLNFSRKVFTRCVKAISIVRDDIYSKDLHEELISNDRRLNEIMSGIKRIKTIKQLYSSGLSNLITSLSNSDVSGSKRIMIQIGVILLSLAKKEFRKTKTKDAIKLINKMLKMDENTSLADLSAMYNDLHGFFSSLYLKDNARVDEKIEELAYKSAMYSFTSFMSWRLMFDAFNKR